MLPKPNRLNLKTDFKWVVSGDRISTQYIKLFFRTGSNALPRVGIALSKSEFKKAVDRNRAKRLVSKAFEDVLDQLPSAINIVAMPSSGVLDISSVQLSQGLKNTLQECKIIQ